MAGTRTTMIPFARVLAAVREHVAGHTGDPGRRYFQAHPLVTPVGEALGVDTRTHGKTYSEQRYIGAFAAQVRRSLEVLATEGVLIKVGRGERRPGGGKPYGGVPEYYTQRGWQLADEAGKAAQARTAALDRRWTVAHDRARERGLEVSHTRGSEWGSVKLDSLERLLGLDGEAAPS
jgi:hypothetical protein